MSSAIKLPFKQINGSGIPTIFLHGFLGSHKNFTRMTRDINKQLGLTTLALDLRNHGSTIKTPTQMNYSLMALDLQNFIKEQNLQKVNLIGYSMGAKIAMLVNLGNPNLVQNLVCLDNAPIVNDIGPDFPRYIEAMKQFNHWAHDVLEKSNIDIREREWKLMGIRHMKHLVQDDAMALYLFDNFIYDKAQKTIESKVPLDYIDSNWFKMLGSWPEQSLDKQINNRVLFIKAADSQYINKEAEAKIQSIFPNHGDKIVNVISGGHDEVLVSHYKTTLELITNFLSEK
ncbi:Abhydrolase domain-containing protein 11 [Wickerhamomyces ciferrii]|uniref:Abhydrolase domain-containing protein 11 n=1 Tax=Wickerhamomyces ciferrii (strain ATCC 14091 / BCRC 22168 / CBS 111 / JCM 3599 / NBRC 0793 / NRRL Y-1031 F-60-10) TaxID=1206466 RepID=K0KND4_WICCF|nr:Abhydrolase domain-containing protein 11 [Wickerhamomyces ciferrii]CCH44501.1 Abhydrolase domain-containing protein 11 [Wickerhamomyces ciferrii]